jgi:DNA-binding NarL/FixJ family response regulator
LILVVDDDIDVRASLVDVLASRGHRVITAAHGLEAISLLRDRMTERPDLILLDIGRSRIRRCGRRRWRWRSPARWIGIRTGLPLPDRPPCRVTSGAVPRVPVFPLEVEPSGSGGAHSSPEEIGK